MRHPLLIAAVASVLSSFSQEGNVPPIKTFQPSTVHAEKGQAVDSPAVHQPGEVTILQDEKIAGLMDDFAKRKHVLKGYRVQIYLGDRNEAEDLRRSFLSKHGDTPAYLSYLAPNFRVRVGDLRTHLEAEKLRQSFKDDYPGSYIVPDEIEMPRLPE